MSELSKDFTKKEFKAHEGEIKSCIQCFIQRGDLEEQIPPLKAAAEGKVWQNLPSDNDRDPVEDEELTPRRDLVGERYQENLKNFERAASPPPLKKNFQTHRLLHLSRRTNDPTSAVNESVHKAMQLSEWHLIETI